MNETAVVIASETAVVIVLHSNNKVDCLNPAGHKRVSSGSCGAQGKFPGRARSRAFF